MEALKLSGMQVIQDLKTEEELDVLRDFLLTDPLKITHSINFWKQELPNADEAEKAVINQLITSLKAILRAQVEVTARVYSLSTTEEKSETVVAETKAEVIEEKQETVKENKQQVVNPSVAALHVVKDEIIEPDAKRILRVKYEAMIKNLTMDELKAKVMPLINNPITEAEAVEMATFLLSEGLYKGKKAKKMDQKFIDKWLDSCRPKTVKAPVQTAEQADTGSGVTEEVSTEAPAADEDLYAKYAHYLGDNKASLTGIKTEVKFLMSEGKIEEAIQIAAFLLGAGEYVDSKPEKWSAQQIEDFIKVIKDDLKANPMDLGPKEEIKEEPVVVAETNTEEKPEYDTKIDKFYIEIENKIFIDNLDITTVKQWIFDEIKARKIECVDMFYNVESTSEELNSMYTTFFESFVNIKFQEKAVKAVDMNEEIARLISVAIENKETLLTSVIQETGKLYAKRGETVNIKEVRDIVYRVAADKYPEFYAKMMDIVGKKNKANKEEKVAIVQDKVDFATKHPEIWETVKDAKNLDDVYTMARELEKTQSFLVVSEMIIHLISSGKINDKDGNPVKWDNAAIELWINTTFTPAETVAETTAEVVTEAPVEETPAEVVPTAEVASPEVTNETSSQEEVSSPTEQVSQENTAPSETVEAVESSSATAVQESIAEESNITYPKGITIPEEHKDLKELYAAKKEGFYDGFVKIINGLTTEGKTKKEITHTIADALMKIANDKTLSQCFARNLKGVNIDGLYKMINAKADKLEIPGWKVE